MYVQERSSGTRFDHGQFQIRTFPIYAPPYWPVRVRSHLDDNVKYAESIALDKCIGAVFKCYESLTLIQGLICRFQMQCFTLF